MQKPIFTVRPSKTFLFNWLRKHLATKKGGVGLDAASATLKNKKFFQTDVYIGFDYDKNFLKTGIKNFGGTEKLKEHGIVPVLGDLIKMEAFPSNSCDVVLSTNSLYHIKDRQKRLKATLELARVTKTSGICILDLQKDDLLNESIKALKEVFETVDVWYFRNKFSLFYERLFQDDNGDMTKSKLANTKLFRLFAWKLSLLEYLTRRWKWFNQECLVLCERKKETGVDQEVGYEEWREEDGMRVLL